MDIKLVQLLPLNILNKIMDSTCVKMISNSLFSWFLFINFCTLPEIDPVLHVFATQLGSDFSDVHNALRVKEKSHRKLSLATTIPTSARLGFKLLASTSVQETATFRAG
jgi:hypothetical protein